MELVQPRIWKFISALGGPSHCHGKGIAVPVNATGFDCGVPPTVAEAGRGQWAELKQTWSNMESRSFGQIMNQTQKFVLRSAMKR